MATLTSLVLGASPSGSSRFTAIYPYNRAITITYTAIASNSRPSLLGLVQLANACARTYSPDSGEFVYFSVNSPVYYQKRGVAFGKALSSPSFLAPSKYFSASLASVYLF